MSDRACLPLACPTDEMRVGGGKRQAVIRFPMLATRRFGERRLEVPSLTEEAILGRRRESPPAGKAWSGIVTYCTHWLAS